MEIRGRIPAGQEAQKGNPGYTRLARDMLEHTMMESDRRQFVQVAAFGSALSTGRIGYFDNEWRLREQ